MTEQTPAEVIEQVMACLSFPDDFGMNPESGELEAEEYYHEMLQEYFPDATITYGVSKFVIIVPSLSFVIKIPFNGSYTYDGDFYYFENAGTRKRDDYCYSEWCKYRTALDNGFEKFFAKIEYYDDDADGHPYYYQEKVISAYKYHGETASAASYGKVDELSAEQMICDSDWLARAIDMYGEELVTAFIDYVNNIDPDIGADLHRNNYGYRENGEPVLLDYSGWND